MPASVRTPLLANLAPLYPQAEHHLLPVNPIRITHAIADFQASGRTPDIRHYLRGFEGYLKDSSAPPVFRLPAGGTDYKRRASEDCGVGFACLLVNNLDVPWRNIVQIPGNTKGQGKHPDFLATKTGMDLVFEAKGTTDVTRLPTTISRGKRQVEEYENPADAKLCIASLVPIDGDPFNAHTIVTDPPGARTEMMDVAKEHLDRLVTYRVLRFAGFMKTAKAVGEVLSWEIRDKQSKADPVADLRKELERAPRQRVGDIVLAGARRWSGNSLVVFAGVEESRLIGMVQGDKTIRGLDDAVQWREETHTAVSTFSDGSVMTIEGKQSNAIRELKAATLAASQTTNG